MNIGVTGTRFGATDDQLLRVADFMITLGPGNELHHGDCVGVDVQVATIAKELGWKIICHPPIKTELQGFFGGDEVRPSLSHFARNRNIVKETELLMVVPWQSEPSDRGGTWYTYDYAVKNNKLIRIFYP